MATQESNVRSGGSVLGGLFMLVAILVLVGIGYVYWPKVKATYYAQPAAQIVMAQQQMGQQQTPRSSGRGVMDILYPTWFEIESRGNRRTIT